jgi:hypothetical protein
MGSITISIVVQKAPTMVDVRYRFKLCNSVLPQGYILCSWHISNSYNIDQGLNIYQHFEADDDKVQLSTPAGRLQCCVQVPFSEYIRYIPSPLYMGPMILYNVCGIISVFSLESNLIGIYKLT